MPGTEDLFLKIFDSVKTEIRSQRGCLGLEILRSSNEEGTSICTISLWQSIDDIETYRGSSLFQKTWSDVRKLFSSKAMAWTLTSIETML